MDNTLPTTSVQTTLINANSTSSLLNILLLGIYTTVYIGTVYIYVTRKASRNIYVLLSITILYLTNIAQTGVFWFLLHALLGLAGQSKEQFFIFALVSTTWAVLANDIFLLVLSTVADGLLIWRCYNVWDCSIRAILLSLVFLVGEVACYLAVIICAAVTHLHPPGPIAIKMDDLLAAAFFTSLGSTLFTTGMIVFRILSVSQNAPARSQYRTRYVAILDLIVQSAALYSAALIVSALVSAIPLRGADEDHMQALAIAQDFIGAIFPVVAGFAPTLMVARVSLAASAGPKEQSTAGISDLEFGAGQASTNKSNQDHAGMTEKRINGEGDDDTSSGN